MTRIPSPNGTPCPDGSTGPDQGKTRPDVQPLIVAKRGVDVVYLARYDRDTRLPRPLEWLMGHVSRAVSDYAGVLGLRFVVGTIGDDHSWPGSLGDGHDLIALNLVGGVPMLFRFAAGPVDAHRPRAVAELRAHAQLNEIAADAVDRFVRQYADQLGGQHGSVEPLTDGDQAPPDVQPLISVVHTAQPLAVALEVRRPEHFEPQPLDRLIEAVTLAVGVYGNVLDLRIDYAELQPDDDYVAPYDRRRADGVYDLVAVNAIDGVPCVFRFDAPPPASPLLGSDVREAHDRLTRAVERAVQRYSDEVAGGRRRQFVKNPPGQPLVDASFSDDRVHIRTHRPDPTTAPALAWAAGFVTGHLIEYADELGVDYDHNPDAVRAGPPLLSLVLVDGRLVRRLVARTFDRPVRDLPPLAAAQADQAYDRLVERCERVAQNHNQQAGVRPLASLVLVDGLAVLRVEQGARDGDGPRDVLVDQFIDLVRPVAQQLGVRLAVGVADGQPPPVDRGAWVRQAYVEQLTGSHQPINRPGVYDVTKRIRVDDEGSTTMLDHPDGVPVAGFWPKTTTLVQPVDEPVDLRTTLCLTPHHNDDVGAGKHGCVELMGHERRNYNGAALCRCACGVTWRHPSAAAGVDRG